MKKHTALVFLMAGCSTVPDSRKATSGMNAESLLAHIRKLASDEFEGRAPASKGEDLTVAYIEEQFRKFGAKPGNPDGTYIQKTPLAGFTATTTAAIQAAGKKIALTAGKDFVAVSRVQATYDPANEVIETVTIRPKKTGIVVNSLVLR